MNGERNNDEYHPCENMFQGTAMNGELENHVPFVKTFIKTRIFFLSLFLKGLLLGIVCYKSRVEVWKSESMFCTIEVRGTTEEKTRPPPCQEPGFYLPPPFLQPSSP